MRETKKAKPLKPRNFYEQITVLYQKGLTYSEIAARVRKSRSGVVTGINQLRSLGLPLYRGRNGSTDRPDLVGLRDELDLSRLHQLVQQTRRSRG